MRGEDYIVGFFQAGTFFGDYAVCHSTPHTTTARSLSTSDLLTLPAAELALALSLHPDSERNFLHVSNENERSLKSAIQSPTADTPASWPARKKVS